VRLSRIRDTNIRHIIEVMSSTDQKRTGTPRARGVLDPLSARRFFDLSLAPATHFDLEAVVEHFWTVTWSLTAGRRAHRRSNRRGARVFRSGAFRERFPLDYRLDARGICAAIGGLD
jgi:hypothetical protein